MRKYFYCPTDNLEAFRKAAEAAVSLGATHMFISDLPKSRWQWMMDPSDPYPNWGMMHCAIFKVVPMPELAPWVPQDYVQKNWAILLDRAAILKELGLRAAFKGCEPGWLPQGVYEAHPAWRGARCDHPRRSRKAYFSPCIDNEEVLALYHRAVKKLCREIGVEVFSFLTNDSGGGICWSRGLYPGENGPAACKHISFAKRITRFLGTIQEAAAAAGVAAQVSIAGSIPDYEVQAAIPSLQEGQIINGFDRHGKNPVAGIGSQDEWYGDCVYPVRAIPAVFRYMDAAVAANSGSAKERSVNLDSIENSIMLRLVTHLEKDHPESRYAGMESLRRFAAQEAGEKYAEALLEIWRSIDLCVRSLRPIEEGGPLLLLGTVNQRWLIRPLSPLPLELPEQLRKTYRPYQFQANSEAEAADLMNLQGTRLVSGHSAAFLAGNLLREARNSLRYGYSCLEPIWNHFPEKTKTDYQFLCHQMKLLACVIRTAENCIGYQEVLDRSDFSQPPVETPIWHVPSDQRLLQLQRIARDEVDNVEEMLQLLSRYPLQQQLWMAARADEEDIFLMSPDLLNQLREKRRVTLVEMQRAYSLYTRFN